MMIASQVCHEEESLLQATTTTTTRTKQVAAHMSGISCTAMRCSCCWQWSRGTSGGHGMPPRSLHGGRRRTAFRAWHAVRVCYVNLVGCEAFKHSARWGWEACVPMNASSMYHRPVKADSSSDWGVCTIVTPSGWAHWSCNSPCVPALLPAQFTGPACWVVTLHKQASSRPRHPSAVDPSPTICRRWCCCCCCPFSQLRPA